MARGVGAEAFVICDSSDGSSLRALSAHRGVHHGLFPETPHGAGVALHAPPQDGWREARPKQLFLRRSLMAKASGTAS